MVQALIAHRYRVLGVLGSGGLSRVLEVEHEGLRFAAKVLRVTEDGDPRQVERVVREAQVTARLDHPGIVRVHEVVHDDEYGAVIVMERLVGAPLSSVAHGRHLSLAQVRRVGLAVLAALDVAHKAGVVHRDIKPANVFVARDPEGNETIKIVDFGIAGLDGATTLTEAGEVLGTPRYASPEHAMGLEQVGPTSDLYSVAATLVDLVAGPVLPLPFGCTSAAIDAALRRAGLPVIWQVALRRALAPRPQDRFPSAKAMAAALGALPVEGTDEPLLSRLPRPDEVDPGGYPDTLTDWEGIDGSAGDEATRGRTFPGFREPLPFEPIQLPPVARPPRPPPTRGLGPAFLLFGLGAVLMLAGAVVVTLLLWLAIVIFSR